MWFVKDSDECQLDGSCDQICTNTPGSFNCSCVIGYIQVNNTRCKAVNGMQRTISVLLIVIILLIS